LKGRVGKEKGRWESVGDGEVYFDDFKVEHIKSPVIEEQSYYPFGLTFGNYQRENSLSNQYKFNGIEQIDDLSLNVLNAKFRIGDPTTGRWWQLDPKPDQSYSLYSMFSNNPVRYSDPLGDTVQLPNASKEFINNYNQATNKLRENGVSGNLNDLESSKETYNVVESKDPGSSYNSKTKTISWNPKMGMITGDANVLSPATILNHEVDHGARDDKDPEGMKADGKVAVEGYGNKEEQRVIQGSEQRTAKELGEIGFDQSTRNDHFGTLFPTMGSTSTELDFNYYKTDTDKSTKKKNP
jgi:RHS repeat-associated protein